MFVRKGQGPWLSFRMANQLPDMIGFCESFFWHCRCPVRRWKVVAETTYA